MSSIAAETPAQQKGRQQVYRDLWWLAEELTNIADAIGPVPDLAETSLRAQANLLREIIAPLGYDLPALQGEESMSDLRMLDATDPDEWGPAVERVAEKLAEKLWGAPHWYRCVANDVLTAAFDDTDLDPKDTYRVACRYFYPPGEPPTREEMFSDG